MSDQNGDSFHRHVRVKKTHAKLKDGRKIISRNLRCHSMFRKLATSLLMLLIALGASGCAPIIISAAGVGAGAVFSHHINGQSSRTFTASLPRVRVAVLAALKKMSIKPGATEKTEQGQRITAKAGDRNIEIELEVVTPSTTLMRTVARNQSGLTVDSATAAEITNQTEAAVGRG
ncbi:DUF3568 family protein [Dechloromonas sp.]|uniref:DUF3568 family protein n=1 Tax=Dechloromonas sp. TaxID=1917218 RepID=UPI00286D7CFD|nr:DUF3568 family protein [Dechloromonas sp.]